MKEPRRGISLLVVGVDVPLASTSALDVSSAATGRGTIAALRMFAFDLLLVGHHINDMSVWSLMRVVRSHWSAQRWALVAQGGGAELDQEEIRARCLGAVYVFPEAPTVVDLERLAAALPRQ